MPSIRIDPDEFRPLIDQVVEAAVRRLLDEGTASRSRKLLLDKREAAQAMSISVATLDRITHPRGKLRAVRLDGRVLYSPEAIEAWIDSHILEGSTP